MVFIFVVTTNRINAAPSFELDVMPLFMKHGCNAGDCHGAARGKDGFMLSLFGYDPEGDLYRLIEEHPGRRINVADPAKSLLLQKGIGSVPHTGGELFKKDSESYRMIYDWIKAGANRDPEGTPEVKGIRLEPEVTEFSAPNGTRTTKVIATYTDGSERDVTKWSLYLSSNDGVAGIDDQGVITANRAGGAHVFARFSRFTEGSEVIVLPEGKFEWSPPPVKNYIDERVFSKLKKLRIHPSPISEDHHFLRRVTIDLTGMLPTPDEYESFLASNDPDKRARVIDELISREDFAELWAAKWGEWLRIKTDTNPAAGTSVKAGWTYFHWLREQFIEDRPLNEIFDDLLTGTGSNLRNPTSNFYTMIPQANTIDPGVLGKDVALVTMGIRTDCAECHNHPFDRWTMDDYYGWTSFFTGIERKRGREAREMLISVNVDAPPAAHKLDDRPMPHRFLGGEEPDVSGEDPRRVLADWLTAEDNRLFRRNLANRIWEHFFGRGIVDPVDDIRISNPPSNEPLLEELGRRLAEDHGFSLRNLARDICNSQTYQLSATTNESNRSDEEFFSHSLLRRPRADVLFDCIAQAMDYQQPIRRSSRKKAIDLFEGGRGDNHNSYFYSTFGQARRESCLASETNNEASLSQALHLINGVTIDRALTRNPVLIPQLMKMHPDDPGAVISALYIRTLTRAPSPAEMDVIMEGRPETGDSGQLRNFYNGVMWSLLNSSEFLFNH